MKVTIIRTPSILPISHITSMSSVPDIGTTALATYLNQNGHPTTIIDAQGEALDQYQRLGDSRFNINGLLAEQILERIPSATDVVLVSCMHTHRWPYDSHIIKKLLEKNFLVIVGGEHATTCFKEILEQFNSILAVCHGEGEVTVLELLNNLSSKNDMSQIKGISFIKEGILCTTPRRDRISNLDSLPFPNWSLIPIEKYLSRCAGINSHYFRSLPLYTSRGCPNACKFCTCPSMWYSTFIQRSVTSVVEEMRSHALSYNVEHFDLVDLTLDPSTSWPEEFADALIATGLNLKWSLPIGTLTKGLTFERLKKLSQSGLIRILYASETGSKKVSKNIGKNTDLIHYQRVLRWSVKAGLIVKITMIYGFPDQTWEDVYRSLALTIKSAILGVNDIVCLSFVPYPGTVFYKQLAVNYSYTQIGDQSIRLNNDIATMKSWSYSLSDRQLRLLVLFTMGIFYLIQFIIRPWRFISAIYRALICKRPLTNFESLLYHASKVFLGAKK